MSPRLRALFINEGSLGPGVMGQLQAGQMLHAALARSDLDTEFRTLPAMSLGTKVLTRGVPYLGARDLDLQPVRWHLAQAVRARRILRWELARRRPEVLHVHGHTLGLLLEREMRWIPTVLSLDATVWDWHAMGIWRDTQRWSRSMLWPSIALERRAFAAARSITAYTHWTADGVRRELPDARVVQLHPGIDVERYRPAPRWPRERPRALFVGGRFEAKGGLELLEAARPLLGVALDLDIVTPAPVPWVPGTKVHRFQPNEPGLIELFQQADILVLPSHGDVAPWVVLEAMACRVAVLAYDVGAIGELLGGGECGILVREGDVRGLGLALERLTSDPELRARLGKAARARVEACYDARRQNPQLLDLLRRTAHEGLEQ